MASIYALFDPKDGSVIYIGKANDPAARLASHMRDSRRRDTPIYRWIRENGKPGMVVLKRDCEDWKSEERRLIAEARSMGQAHLNVAAGGDEPCPTPESLKRAAATANRKRPANVMRAMRMMETCIRMAAPHKREDLREKYAKFRASVDHHREAGTMAFLNDRLGIYFSKGEAA